MEIKKYFNMLPYNKKREAKIIHAKKNFYEFYFRFNFLN